MSVRYSDAACARRFSAVIAMIDQGAGFGQIRVLDASNVTLAVVPFKKPCGVAVGRNLTFNCVPPISDVSADNAGIADHAQIEDSDGNIVIDNLSVGTSGTNVIVTTTNIVAGQVFPFTSAVISTPYT